MKLMLIKGILAPILLFQGAYVRRKTPLLPEPVIDKQGLVGAGPEMRLLLVGDSSAAGVGADTAADSLLGQLIKLLSQNHQLSYQMLAETGKTTLQTIHDIKALPEQKMDVIITALGVNDVTSQVPVKTWCAQQRELIQRLKHKFSPSKVIISGLPPMGDFPALPWPLSFYLGCYANTLNSALQGLVDADSQVMFHSLRNYPEVAAVASDGFHPGPEVYRLWAKYLVEMVISKD